MKSVEEFCRKMRIDYSIAKDFPKWLTKYIGKRQLLVKGYCQGIGNLQLTNMGEVCLVKDIPFVFTESYWGIKLSHRVNVEIAARLIKCYQRNGTMHSIVQISLEAAISIGGLLLLVDETTALLLYGGQEIPSEAPKYEDFQLLG